jgi:uncharacterized protein involved in tolerance to divalent cations
MRKLEIFLLFASFSIFVFNLSSSFSLDHTINVNLNASYYWWNEGVKVYGNVRTTDGNIINNSEVRIYLEQKLVCNTTTNESGDYQCEFKAPPSVGNYNLIINVTDKQTGETFTNFTRLIVKLTYGVREEEMERAKQASCYEIPQLIINPDGGIKLVFVKVCVLR